MGRPLWAAHLPADLSKEIEARRFSLENTSELCNRLILDLIDWVRDRPVEAMERSPLRIDLDTVSHPENIEASLAQVLFHDDGFPVMSVPVGNNWRQSLYENTRVVVEPRSPEKTTWQLRALESVDTFLHGLEFAASRSERVEVALRWAVQQPRVTEWSAEEVLAWLTEQYGMNLVSIAECLEAVPRRVSRKGFLTILEQLERNFQIDLSYAQRNHPWVTVGGNGVRSLQVAPHREYVQVNAYRLRDAIVKRKSSREYIRWIDAVVNRDRWLQVRWRSTTLGFLVGDEAGQQICPNPKEFDLREMTNPAFFKAFSGAINGMRESKVDCIRIISKAGDAVVLFAPATTPQK